MNFPISMLAYERNGWSAAVEWRAALLDYGDEACAEIESLDAWDASHRAFGDFFCVDSGGGAVCDDLAADSWEFVAFGPDDGPQIIHFWKDKVWTEQEVRRLNPKFLSWDVPGRISFDGCYLLLFGDDGN